MRQIHVVIRRVNPALKIDLVQVGCIKDGQFVQLSLDTLDCTPLTSFIKSSSISDSAYIEHDSIARLIEALTLYLNFTVEFFDNTLVLMFDFNLDHNESPSKEEGKGN